MTDKLNDVYRIAVTLNVSKAFSEDLIRKNLLSANPSDDDIQQAYISLRLQSDTAKTELAQLTLRYKMGYEL